MRANPFDYAALRAQIRWQRERTWDLERGIAWEIGVDHSRCFLPLDQDAIAFPGASEEQRLVLSQYLGLVINATISEMEGVIHKLKDVAWNQVLRRFPVNPEMWELGELFFEEEIKHARMFGRYNQIFCESAGIDPGKLHALLPRAFGSMFQKAVIANARGGGHAFWWLVASAEEVSIEIYRAIRLHQSTMDPLYHLIHKKHLEDESRHRNYAFLMLALIEQQGMPSLSSFYHRKTDLLFAQAFSTAWVLTELSKVFDARALAKDHPFFETLASCFPLVRQVPLHELARRLFVTGPYVSLVLNTRNQRNTTLTAEEHKVLQFPFPKPRPAEVSGGKEVKRWKR
jgi:hypothetical protein